MIASKQEISAIIRKKWQRWLLLAAHLRLGLDDDAVGEKWILDMRVLEIVSVIALGID